MLMRICDVMKYRRVNKGYLRWLNNMIKLYIELEKPMYIVLGFVWLWEPTV